MIKSKLYTRNGTPAGFEITGHAGYADFGDDIVCAAVSSAAYMTANTVTDVCMDDADIIHDASRLYVLPCNIARCRDILEGFRLHICALAAQYPEHITVKTIELTTEVESDA